MKFSKLAWLVLVAAVLSGCGRNVAAAGEAVSMEPPLVFDAEEGESVRASKHFFSQDKITEYTVSIDQRVPALPVVEVETRLLTGEDAQRAAQVLLPEAEFFKAKPTGDPMTKKQLQRKINLYSQFTDANVLESLYGPDSENALTMVKESVHQWTNQLQSAPDKDDVPCDWKLRPERDFFNSPWEIGKRPIWEDDDCLYAVTYVHGVEYMLSAGQYDNGERYSTMFLSTTCGWDDFEAHALRSRMCRTQKPTEEEIDVLKAKAQGWLNQMNLGQWQVVYTELLEEKAGDATEYLVELYAVPMVCGLASYWDYFGAYRRGSAIFQLTADGELYSFDLACPIQAREKPQDVVETMPVEQALERAWEQLPERDEETVFGPLEERYRLSLEKQYGENVLRKVEISHLEARPGRMQLPGVKNRASYVPFIGLYGKTEYVGGDSGKVYDSDDGQILWVSTATGDVFRHQGKQDLEEFSNR